MYNKYRTQFEVIHTLEKKIGIPKPLIAQLKHKLRYEIALEEMQRFQNGRCVKDFGDGSAILLLPIIGTYFDTSLDEAIRIFEAIMKCGALTVLMIARDRCLPYGISWSNGRECGTHITTLVATAKQEKGNMRAGKIFSANSSQPADPERSINYEMAK